MTAIPQSWVIDFVIKNFGSLCINSYNDQVHIFTVWIQILYR